MPITAIDSEQVRAFGYQTVQLLPTANTRSQLVQVSNKIIQDLNTTANPPSTEGNIWGVQWYPIFYVPNTTTNASKFASALPKQNLGAYTYLYRGQASLDGFINYASQRGVVAVFWTTDFESLFPSDYIPPEPVTNAQLLEFAYLLSPTGETTYADSVEVILQQGVPQDAQLTAYYQAVYADFSPPASFGDI